MSMQSRILLLDDDQDFLELYQKMLSQHLPSAPAVHTALTGVRALSLMEAEPFTLLIVDLNLPKMDGLQVLSIARRKYPHLRLMVLTGIRDEQFRTRAYAMGVDQYWIKPESDQDMGLLLESIETLLSTEAQGGFRGVQSKGLVDIIQLECLSQSSAILKITHGIVEARIWFQNGEVIDAETQDLTGEAAFQKILSWKAGNFEILPGDPERTRTIFTAYQGLLLNTAQALDEAASQAPRVEANPEAADGSDTSVFTSAPLLAELSQLHGVDFVLALGVDKLKTQDYWGLENPQQVADWTRETLKNFQALGDRLQVGQLQQVLGLGRQHKVTLTSCAE